MWMWRAIILTALLVQLPTQAICQPPRGRGGRSPFFEAMREAHRSSPNREMLDLIHDKPVRTEIGLDEDEFRVLHDRLEQAMDSIRELGDKSRDSNKSVETLRDEILKILAPVELFAFDALKKQSDFERLVGLYVQQKNFSAAANSEIAKRINLPEEDLKEFRETRAAKWRQSMESTRNEIERMVSNGRSVRHEIEKVFQEAGAQLDASLAEELTSDQKMALENLKGKPFADLPKRGPPPPPNGGNGGGRGFEPGPPKTRSQGNDNCPDDKGGKDKGGGDRGERDKGSRPE